MVTVELKEGGNKDNTIGVGSYWTDGINGNIYFLSNGGKGTACGLVEVSTGRGWGDPLLVVDILSLSTKEIGLIMGHGNFTPIKSGTITINISEDKD